MTWVRIVSVLRKVGWMECYDGEKGFPICMIKKVSDERAISSEKKSEIGEHAR